MGTQRSHGFETADGGAAERPAPDAVSRRRALLGAASGFALATSGLLLPEWLVEETAAADHPVARVHKRAGKRRDRKHHRLKQKRTQQRHQQNQDASGAPGVGRKVLRFGLHNGTNVNIWLRLVTQNNGEPWKLEPDVTDYVVTPGATAGGYPTASDRIGFLLNNPHATFDINATPFFWVDLDRGNFIIKTTWQGYGGAFFHGNNFDYSAGLFFFKTSA